MFRLECSRTFEAAHSLPNHDGKCKRPHGHSFHLTIVCEGKELVAEGPKKSMLLDYGVMKFHLDLLVHLYLDHHHLNETLAPFGVSDPTSEEVCKWVYNQLRGTVPMLVEVQIAETCTSKCVYRPSEHDLREERLRTLALKDATEGRAG